VNGLVDNRSESMSHAPGCHRWEVIAVVLAGAAAATGCAVNSSIQWNPPLIVTALPPTGPVFVMEPIVVGAASPGNIGRDFPTIKRTVVTRILTIVRERLPGAEMVEAGPQAALGALPGYGTATGEEVVAMEEFNAANLAYQRGATHLLVPIITEWKEMRTDDPIGTLIVPHNSITLTLRLMRLQPPALVGRVIFRNRARLTLNQPAARLLNDRFRQVVLQLVSGRV
jgi:hypothetical protein